MYLNAEVYTGKARYSECINACNEVIKAGYQLADNYADLFKADNGENPDTKKEIIYPIIFDGDKTNHGVWLPLSSEPEELKTKMFY